MEYDGTARARRRSATASSRPISRTPASLQQAQTAAPPAAANVGNRTLCPNGGHVGPDLRRVRLRRYRERQALADRCRRQPRTTDVVDAALGDAVDRVDHADRDRVRARSRRSRRSSTARPGSPPSARRSRPTRVDLHRWLEPTPTTRPPAPDLRHAGRRRLRRVDDQLRHRPQPDPPGLSGAQRFNLLELLRRRACRPAPRAPTSRIPAIRSLQTGDYRWDVRTPVTSSGFRSRWSTTIGRSTKPGVLATHCSAREGRLDSDVQRHASPARRARDDHRPISRRATSRTTRRQGERPLPRRSRPDRQRRRHEGDARDAAPARPHAPLPPISRSMEVSRNSPIVATINGNPTIVQGTYEFVTPPGTVTTFSTNADGHAGSRSRISRATCARPHDGRRSRPPRPLFNARRRSTFDASGAIPTRCTPTRRLHHAVHGTCRTVFTTTDGGRTGTGTPRTSSLTPQTTPTLGPLDGRRTSTVGEPGDPDPAHHRRRRPTSSRQLPPGARRRRSLDGRGDRGRARSSTRTRPTMAYFGADRRHDARGVREQRGRRRVTSLGRELWAYMPRVPLRDRALQHRAHRWLAARDRRVRRLHRSRPSARGARS